MAKPEMEFFDPDLVPWEPEADIEGLYSKTLAADPDAGSYTRLLKFEPGTDTSPAGVQRHPHWEEIWIVEGAITDLTLDKTFTAGMYACRPPGMAHGPWIAPFGCITFEVRNWEGSA
jgi:ChrR Cupin-like domain